MKLTISNLKQEAALFAEIESTHYEPEIYATTDGKAVGTYLEHKFLKFLQEKTYQFTAGNSAKGIDFPELLVDIKTTSNRQPQSSCPFDSARQKIYGLGYSLLIFVYNKEDLHEIEKSRLIIQDVIFVESERTADWQTTNGIQKILENEGNADDLIAFFEERTLPIDSITAAQLAEEILANPPKIGYLTISNALQWRLQYKRVIEKAGTVEGIIRVK